MYYLTKNLDTTATIYTNKKYINDIPYISILELPNINTGEVLCIDDSFLIVIKSEKEIIEKYHNIPTESKTIDLVQENKLLKAQLQAQTDRSDFIEDCIAEMAGVVYNTEETT